MPSCFPGGGACVQDALIPFARRSAPGCLSQDMDEGTGEDAWLEGREERRVGEVAG